MDAWDALGHDLPSGHGKSQGPDVLMGQLLELNELNV